MGEKNTNPPGPAGNTVRANIRQRRIEQRLTYVAMSEKLASAGRPIPVLGLRRIERGERRVDVDDLCAIAATLGARPQDLLGVPPVCPTCNGTPPRGFICASCGAGAQT